MKIIEHENGTYDIEVVVKGRKYVYVNVCFMGHVQGKMEITLGMQAYQDLCVECEKRKS